MTAYKMSERKGEVEESGVQVRGNRSLLSLACGTCLVLTTVTVTAAILGAVFFFAVAPSCDNGEPVALADHDKVFKMRGSFLHHRFDEDCHYDHFQNLLVKELTGDGFGDNATVIYDFKRRLLTYKVHPKKMCLITTIQKEDMMDLADLRDGETIELPETMGRNFTTRGTIPAGFLQLNSAPIVQTLCTDLPLYWMESTDEGAVTRTDRAAAALAHCVTTTTTTTTTTSDGTSTTTTTTTTTC